ncbi:hypothetical protein cyc_06003 [Cyclospora cayetanensis]|uniref:Transmembrane protein n=1 Tax=Cyclospora cayetanensis TaxID=88456 RepID=A0A1D3CT47_9EIME|nr:hypothetical protein cyc_06003 [Cyclospora cayetanensis]
MVLGWILWAVLGLTFAITAITLISTTCLGERLCHCILWPFAALYNLVTGKQLFPWIGVNRNFTGTSAPYELTDIPTRLPGDSPAPTPDVSFEACVDANLSPSEPVLHQIVVDPIVASLPGRLLTVAPATDTDDCCGTAFHHTPAALELSAALPEVETADNTPCMSVIASWSGEAAFAIFHSVSLLFGCLLYSFCKDFTRKVSDVNEGAVEPSAEIQKVYSASIEFPATESPAICEAFTNADHQTSPSLLMEHFGGLACDAYSVDAGGSASALSPSPRGIMCNGADEVVASSVSLHVPSCVPDADCAPGLADGDANSVFLHVNDPSDAPLATATICHECTHLSVQLADCPLAPLAGVPLQPPPLSSH